MKKKSEKRGHANNAQFGFVSLLSLWVCWVSGFMG